ncbi:MAG TPA: hypothetical protein VHK47_21735 [Polyangia bacterium]|nr:hypothetical protein [Polyangia bacterium]
MDPNGKDPLVDPSSEWLRAAQSPERPPASGRHRSSGRHRVRRRTRKPSDIRSKIRVRVWLACTGALIVMVLAIYLALGRGAGGEAGQLVGPPSDVIARTPSSALRVG